MTNIVFKPTLKKNFQNSYDGSNSLLHHSIKNLTDIKMQYTKPYANIKDQESEYQIMLTVPGFTKNSVKIELDDQKLKITGISEESLDTKYIINEMKISNFERTFIIPENANLDSISAKLENGILYVSIPKKVKQPAKIINVL